VVVPDAELACPYVATSEVLLAALQGADAEVLEEVLLPFCAEAGIESPARLESRHLNDLGAGHLDGTRSRSGRPISKARTDPAGVSAAAPIARWPLGQDAGDVDCVLRLPTAKLYRHCTALWTRLAGLRGRGWRRMAARPPDDGARLG
jgi:hypothetical protein